MGGYPKVSAVNLFIITLLLLDSDLVVDLIRKKWLVLNCHNDYSPRGVTASKVVLSFYFFS